MRNSFYLLLLLPLLLLAPSTASAEDVAESIWHGVLKVPGRHMRLAIVPPNDNERQRKVGAVLVSLDEGGLRLAMDSFQRDDESIKFSIKRVKATYQGQVDGDVVKGEWSQGPKPYPLVFERVEQLPPRDVKRAWKGTINAVVQRLDVAFVESKSGDVQFDSITQRAGGFVVEGAIPADGNASKVELKVSGANGTFTGELSADGSDLKGKWKQGFFSLTLNLKRVDPAELLPAAAAERPRPQTPQAPFPYEIQKLKFPSQGGKFELAGTLTIPADKCIAAVALISGSGPQDRDESILGHKPFWVIADHLARHGIATLRYDDRGVGESEGDFDSADTHDLSDDAEAAFKRLQQQFPELPIGLCGHSEGGLIAPLVASRNKDVDFIILLAGPGLRGDEILRLQLSNNVLTPLLPKEPGKSDTESQQIADALERTLAQQRQVLAVVMEEDQADKPSEQIAAEVEDRWNAAHPDAEVMEDERKTLQATAEQFTHTWFRTFLRLEPTIALKKVRCPVLALNGAKDVQVAAETNMAAIRKALADNDAAKKFKIYPELNHLFQRCETGAVSEYEKIEETFNSRPLEDIVRWIHERAKQ